MNQDDAGFVCKFIEKKIALSPCPPYALWCSIILKKNWSLRVGFGAAAGIGMILKRCAAVVRIGI